MYVSGERLWHVCIYAFVWRGGSEVAADVETETVLHQNKKSNTQ